MNYDVIIPCNGVGSRLNLGYNKLLYAINGKTILERTVSKFINDVRCQRIILVIKEQEFALVKDKLVSDKIITTEGGITRQHSVFNGLKLATSEYVLIHDGARANVSKEVIDNVLEGLETHEFVVPTVKSKDACLVGSSYDHEEVLLVQTPQGGNREKLLEAFSNVDLALFRDDISIAAKYYNCKPFTVAGDYGNIKVTTKEDLMLVKEN